MQLMKSMASWLSEWKRGDKMTNENKKVRKAKNAQKRVLVPFNTGIRTHKSKKDYNRQKYKKIDF